MTTTTNRREPSLLITCEHGGNDVPAELRRFLGSGEASQHLRSHRGYDPGALMVAQRIAKLLDAPLEFSTLSRLVIDFNRSLDSPRLFSKFLVNQDEALRQHILDSHYHPYRKRITDAIKRQVEADQSVLHLSVHTFTPRFRGIERKFDIGVLFDPGRAWETRCSNSLLDHLATCGFRVLPNQPYLGIDDGLTTELRTRFAATSYAGIELELNNRIAKLSEKTQAQWCDQIAAAIQQTRLEHLHL